MNVNVANVVIIATISLTNPTLAKFLKQVKFGMAIEHSVNALSPTTAFEVTLMFLVMTLR